MSPRTKRQFGLWDSPITASSLASDRRLEGVAWDSDGRTIVWLEGRSGRSVLVAQAGGGEAPRDLTSELNVRAEVGYGGGDFTAQGGNVYFVVHKTGRIYRQPLLAGSAEPITPEFGHAASPVVSPDGRWLAYVHHDHDDNDRLAIVDTAGKHWPQILSGGHDFYMHVRISPDSKSVCWVAWDHPNMPWDGTLLYHAPLVESESDLPRFGEARVVAGGPDTAIFQPEFTPDGKHLLYVSDETGWGRLVIHDLQTGERRWLTPDGVELGAPAWKQDMQTYAVTHDSRHVIAACSQNGFHSICRIDLDSGASTVVDALAEYTEVVQIKTAPHADRCLLIASGVTTPPRIVEHDFENGTTRVVARSSGETIPTNVLSSCEAVSWKTANDEDAHGLFFAPASDRFEGIGQPPVIALIHGGPTSQVRAGWKSDAQFFTSRGYAVLYVNYRGSTGYGREYMLRLRGNWGICDVEDSISGVQHLADAEKIDPQRTVIMGGSAGGFTVLQTMVTQPEAFTAGINLYGVANQFHLASETHKFETRYLDTMLGPLPEASAIYRERSPVFFADKIRRPLAVFQGDIDQVVPRAQSDEIVAALEKSGTPHVYRLYEDEGHGWRRQDTIEDFYHTVEEFLKQHVLFT